MGKNLKQLCLREAKGGRYHLYNDEERVPKKLERRKRYNFRVVGKKDYNMGWAIDLRAIKRDRSLSKILAKIMVYKVTHEWRRDSQHPDSWKIHTSGNYVVREVIEQNEPEK